MRHYPRYEQQNFDEVMDLIHQQSTCFLQTISDTGVIQNGIFNHLLLDRKLFFHLHRDDEQVKSIARANECLVLFHDVLGTLPSYWLDAKYGGAATTFYRYAEIRCTARFVEDSEEKAELLKSMLACYQPEGGYEPVRYQSPTYQHKIDQLMLLECEIADFRAKWKLGQNRTPNEMQELATKFRDRNIGNDERCANEIEKWVQKRKQEANEEH